MKNLIEKLKYTAYYFSALVRSYPSSKEYSKLINECLDIFDNNENTLTIDSNGFIAYFNFKDCPPIPIWIGNYPYAYGFIWYFPYAAIDKLIYLNPESEGWQKEYENFMFLQNWKKAFANKMPDRKTVFRLHTAVEKVKKQM